MSLFQGVTLVMSPARRHSAVIAATEATPMLVMSIICILSFRVRIGHNHALASMILL